MVTAIAIVECESATIQRLKSIHKGNIIILHHITRAYLSARTTIPQSSLRANFLSDISRPLLPSREFHRVIINGKRHFGLVDNQASGNFMTLDFARRNRIVVEKASVSFMLADGSFQNSIGRAVIDCTLSRRGQIINHCEFHVFAKAVEPLILGLSFLLEARLLNFPTCENHQQCHSKTTNPSLGMPLYKSPSPCVQSQLRIQLKYEGGIKEALVVPDKGSTINAISLACASSLGYRIVSKSPNHLLLQLGNGRIIQSIGIVEASFTFRGNVPHLGPLRSQFVVIENLPFDIIMGNSVLEEYSVFGKNSADFEWAHVFKSHLHFYGFGQHEKKGNDPLGPQEPAEMNKRYQRMVERDMQFEQSEQSTIPSNRNSRDERVDEVVDEAADDEVDEEIDQEADEEVDDDIDKKVEGVHKRVAGQNREKGPKSSAGKHLFARVKDWVKNKLRRPSKHSKGHEVNGANQNNGVIMSGGLEIMSNNIAH